MATPPDAAIKHWRSFGTAEWGHVREGAIGLALGSLLPVVLFYLTYRTGGFQAAVAVVLVWSTGVFAWHWRRTGGPDVFSATTFVFACVKATAGAVSNNQTLYLAFPSLENMIYGSAFLISALLGKPLLALYAQRLYPIPESVQATPTFRRAFIVVSAVWFCGHTLRAIVRLVLLATLPLELYLVADTVAGWPINATMVAFTTWYPLRQLHKAGYMSVQPAPLSVMDTLELVVEEAEHGHGMTEVELKLMPLDGALLDRLAEVDRLGPFEVVGRRHERQRNSFFDSSSRALRSARIGFRCRLIEGQSLALWTVKGDSQHARGVATRTEIELRLGADMPPALALQALQGRAPRAFAEEIDDALADRSLPQAPPYLETATDRRILDLRSPRAEAELALDRMTIPGTAYAELEIEVELKSGDERELDEARRAIEQLGEVRESLGSKLSRAMDYVERNAASSR